MVFGAPHAVLDEVVGVAVTPACGIGLRELRSWAREHMPSQTLPAVLVMTPSLPITSTGKPQRAGFALRVGLPLLDGSTERAFMHSPGDAGDASQLRELPSTRDARPPTQPTQVAQLTPPKGDTRTGRTPTERASSKAPMPQLASNTPVRPTAVHASDVVYLIRSSARVDAADAIDHDTELLGGGFDSLSAVELTLRLRELTGRPLPLTLLWEYPTLHAVLELLGVGGGGGIGGGDGGGGGGGSDDDGGSGDGLVALELSTAGSTRGGGYGPLALLALQLAAVCACNPYGGLQSDGGKVRCLFLHGVAASGALMESLLRSAGWNAALTDVDFICVDAVHPAEPRPEFYTALVTAGVYDTGRKYFDYGLDQTDAEAAVQQSLENIEALLTQHQPDLIGGICDGGLMAAVIASRHNELQLLINVCGMPWERLPPSLREGPLISLPSVHLLGMQDEMLTQDELLSLSRRCTIATTLRHPQEPLIAADYRLV